MDEALDLRIERSIWLLITGCNVDAGVDESAGVNEGVGVDVDVVDIPFELVGEVASAGTVAEAGYIECGAATRHCCTMVEEVWWY